MDESSFVPHGIDTDSWLGFEQRIQQRRFHALIDTARAALAAGDRHTAAGALTEARELNPTADELNALEAQAAARAASAGWRRPARIVALLAVAATLALALNVRREPAEAPAPVKPADARPVPAPAPIPAPAPTTGVTDAPTAADRRRPVPSTPIPKVAQDAPPVSTTPLTAEGRVAFALKRYARTFTGFAFAECAIAMGETAATAVCRTAGDSSTYDVELSLHDDGWMIDSAIAREK
jgi:hypothetical protein